MRVDASETRMADNDVINPGFLFRHGEAQNIISVKRGDPVNPDYVAWGTLYH